MKPFTAMSIEALNHRPPVIGSNHLLTILQNGSVSHFWITSEQLERLNKQINR